MFARFTDPARKAVRLAQEEARALRHSYIGTEHLLLGLLREEDGLASHALRNLGVHVDPAREHVVRIVGAGDRPSGQIPFTPRSKKTLELALREALGLGHNYIGTEHVLLALVRDSDGIAARVLLDLDASSDAVRTEVLSLLPELPGDRPPAPARATRPSPPPPPAEPSAADPARAVLGPAAPALLRDLASVVRRTVGRPPDEGDLLLALARPGSLLGRTLAQLGLDLATLRQALEEQRRRPARGASSQDQALAQLDTRLTELLGEQAQAIDHSDYARAVQLGEERTRLRRVADELRRDTDIHDLRQRLGLAREETDQAG